LPTELTLDLPEGSRGWQLGPDRTWTAADAGRYASWKPFQDPPTRRHRVHDELWSVLVTLEPTARFAVVARLYEWAETPATPRPSHRTLTKDGLREMARGDLIDIGAHSVTHPGLASLPKHLRLGELVDSKAQLEAMLGRPVRGMSFPQGRSSREVQQEAREAGYAFACGSVYEAVTARSDPFHLPRVSVGDWDGGRFASLLARHLPL
jgi:peptidoglycan/xylan/chitin deacetylase (PgdA/CDA1 family)